MGWSTTAPTLPAGASWNDWDYGAQNTTNNYYYFRAGARIARGPNNTVYVAVRIQVKGRTYGVTGEIPLRARVGGAVSQSESNKYTCTGAYGEFTTAKTVYYTGTAAPGQTIWADVQWNSNDSGNVSMTVPAYVSSYTISFDGNGATSGTVAGVTDIYGTNITLPSGDDFRYPGFGFTEWNTAADGSGTAYATGASYTITGAATLYAQWVKTSIPVYINVGGSIKQVEQAYVNVGGTIKECTPYVNVGGQIYGLG